MLIGVDFDNTIIDYDAVFRFAALDAGLLRADFTGGKTAVRDAIRRSEAGETGWMTLQGQVYGRLIGRAQLYEGVLDTLRRFRMADLSLVVVSHKTEFGHFDPHGVNLRRAALEWMHGVGLFDADVTGLTADRVVFEGTRAEKIARIRDLGCRHFVDDLPEVLLDPTFPADVVRHWFAPGAAGPGPGGLRPCEDWREIGDAVLGGP